MCVLKPEEVSTRLITDDAIVEQGTCLLVALSVCSDGGGVGDAQVYDGTHSAGKKILDVSIKDGGIEAPHFIPPILCQQGLYVVIGSNITSVTIRWVALRE